MSSIRCPVRFAKRMCKVQIISFFLLFLEFAKSFFFFFFWCFIKKGLNLKKPTRSEVMRYQLALSLSPYFSVTFFNHIYTVN